MRPDQFCDQCSAVSINGIPCHELGCPKDRRERDRLKLEQALEEIETPIEVDDVPF